MLPSMTKMLTVNLLVVSGLTAGCGDASAPPQGGGDGIDFGKGTNVSYEIRPNAPHPIAQRSAFPEPDETFDQPIPARRLSDEDQFAPEIDPADIPAVVAWEQAGKYVGHDITVEGTIVNLGQSRDGNVHFLNFHRDWRGKFYMVIFDDLAKTLDQPVEQLFKDKRVRVKGKVESHRGRPQIRILSMDQVEFVDE